jgi:hypothetical protein
MTHDQIKPLVTELTFKHCPVIQSEVLSNIGTMAQLEELHFVYSFSDIISFSDEPNDFESEDLVHLQNLKKLKVLTLMYVMIDHYDLLDLKGKYKIGGEYFFNVICMINSISYCSIDNHRVARVRNSQHWIDDKHVRGGF